MASFKSEISNHVNFSAKDEMIDVLKSDESKLVRLFLLSMSISNTITPVIQGSSNEIDSEIEFYKTCKVSYQSSSPDEVALCYFGNYMGYKLLKRNPTTILVENNDSAILEKFNLLACLDFNSKRKRVTLIYQLHDNLNKVLILTKGADSVMWPLLYSLTNEELQMGRDLETASKNGLRTLLLGYAERDLNWWETWSASWNETSRLVEKGAESNHTKGACSHECRLCSIMFSIEQDAKLEFLGATAIEDKLQEFVPESIDAFVKGGIKFWMLTGDKRETAKNIGLACNLVDPDMEVDEPNGSIFEYLDDKRAYPADHTNRLLEIFGRAHQIISQKDSLKELFGIFDTDLDGLISKNDVVAILKMLNLENKSDFSISFNEKKVCWNQFQNIFAAMNLSFEASVLLEIETASENVKQAKAKHLPVSLVIEGNALSALYKDENYCKFRDILFDIAMDCKSVIACRLTPLQKALIVKEVKQRRNIIALAIGDGANDEQMIREANIGVGISGVEGTAAVRASDYAIAKFHFLHTLLFVHGIWNYTRIASMTKFIFYKSILNSMSSYLFGFYSMFSGQQYFNDLISQFYSIAFTAAPVTILASLDKIIPKNVIKENPHAYSAIKGGQFFNAKKFIASMFLGILHCTLIFFICNGSLSIQDINDAFGRPSDFALESTTVFLCIVISANLQIFFDMHSITILHQIGIWGSCVVFSIVLFIMGSTSNINYELLGIPARIFSNPKIYFTCLLAISSTLITTFVIKSFNVLFYPSELQKIILKARSSAENGAQFKIEDSVFSEKEMTEIKKDPEIKRESNLDSFSKRNKQKSLALRRSYAVLYNPNVSSLSKVPEASILTLDEKES
jgi:magnesium-transporting ATPase (P-type)